MWLIYLKFRVIIFVTLQLRQVQLFHDLYRVSDILLNKDQKPKILEYFFAFLEDTKHRRESFSLQGLILK